MKYTTVKVSYRVLERLAFLKKQKKHRSYDSLLRELAGVDEEDRVRKYEYECHECDAPAYKGQKCCEKCGAPFIWG